MRLPDLCTPGLGLRLEPLPCVCRCANVCGVQDVVASQYWVLEVPCRNIRCIPVSNCIFTPNRCPQAAPIEEPCHLYTAGTACDERYALCNAKRTDCTFGRFLRCKAARVPQDGATLYDKDMQVVKQLPAEVGASRDKAINWLAAETIGNGHSVLVFCAARWVRPIPRPRSSD